MANDTKTLEKLAVSETEAGLMLGVSGRTVFALRKQGKIRAVKIGSGMQARVLYPISELKRFLEAGNGGAA
jgi:hypothetical protein